MSRNSPIQFPADSMSIISFFRLFGRGLLAFAREDSLFRSLVRFPKILIARLIISRSDSPCSSILIDSIFAILYQTVSKLQSAAIRNRELVPKNF